MPKSSGILRYTRPDGGYKLILEVDPGLTAVYWKLAPKHVGLRPQRHAPHVTVIRNEIPPDLSQWDSYEGEEVWFEYLDEIRCGEVYWWLEVYSLGLKLIRIDLGLPPSSQFSRPPDGAECFHTTIGNLKI